MSLLYAPNVMFAAHAVPYNSCCCIYWKYFQNSFMISDFNKYLICHIKQRQVAWHWRHTSKVDSLQMPNKDVGGIVVGILLQFSSCHTYGICQELFSCWHLRCNLDLPFSDGFCKDCCHAHQIFTLLMLLMSFPPTKYFSLHLWNLPVFFCL
jgi:hypothetical protein